MNRTMTAVLITASAIASVSCGKDSLEELLTDRSFIFSAAVTHDIQSSRHCLTLTMDKASEADESYSISYDIDSDKSLLLSSLDSKVLSPAIEREYRNGSSETFILPELPIGEHVISITISTEWFSLSRQVRFTISNPAFSIHAETDTNDSDRTSVILTLESGEPRELLLDMTLDGTTTICRDRPTEFIRGSLIREYLPLIYPGEHTIDITVHDDVLFESISLKFNEPARDNVINAAIIPDYQQGRIFMMVDSNTYGVVMKVHARYTVTGVCRWWESGAIIYNDPPSEDQYHKSDYMSISSDSYVMIDGNTEEMLTRRDALVSELESHHKASAIWQKEWDFSGDGGWFYHVVGYTSEHYMLCKESLELRIETDLPKGMSILVSSQIDGLVIDGKSLSKGKTIRIESTQSNK